MSDRNEYIASDAEEALRIFEAEVTAGVPKEWAMETAIKAVRAIEDHCGDAPRAPRDEARETLIRALLSDVTQSHADPESADYNECDKAPCAWCEDAFRVMAAAPRADTIVPSDEANRAASSVYAREAGAAETVPMYHALCAAYAVDFLAAARAPGREP